VLTRSRRGRFDRVELIDAVAVPASTAARGRFSGSEREQICGFGSDVRLDGRLPILSTDLHHIITALPGVPFVPEESESCRCRCAAAMGISTNSILRTVPEDGVSLTVCHSSHVQWKRNGAGTWTRSVWPCQEVRGAAWLEKLAPFRPASHPDRG
jgi:hypothetical protein